MLLPRSFGKSSQPESVYAKAGRVLPLTDIPYNPEHDIMNPLFFAVVLGLVFSEIWGAHPSSHMAVLRTPPGASAMESLHIGGPILQLKAKSKTELPLSMSMKMSK